MLFLGAIIGSVFMCALIVVGMVANWVSGQTLGTTEAIHIFSYETSYSQIGGAVSIFADGLKCLLPFFIVAAWRNNEKPAAFGLGAIFVFCLTWGVYSAISFVMIGSEHLEASAEQSKESRESVISKITKKREQRNLVPVHRELSIVTTDITNKKAMKEFDWAEGCKGTTTIGAKFCDGYRALLAEESSAVTANKLDSEISALEAARDGKANIREINPLAAKIAYAIGTDKSGVNGWKGVLFAVFVEIVAAFGLVWLWQSRGKDKVLDKLPTIRRRTQIALVPLPEEGLPKADPVPQISGPIEEKTPSPQPSPDDIQADIHDAPKYAVEKAAEKRAKKGKARLGKAQNGGNVIDINGPFGAVGAKTARARTLLEVVRACCAGKEGQEIIFGGKEGIYAAVEIGVKNARRYGAEIGVAPNLVGSALKELGHTSFKRSNKVHYAIAGGSKQQAFG